LLDAIQQRSGRAIRAVLMTGETSPEGMGLIKASGWKTLLKPAGLADLLSTLSEGGEASIAEKLAAHPCLEIVHRTNIA